MAGSVNSVRFRLFVAIFMLVPYQWLGASSACDPSILQNHEHPQGYRDRGDQVCEGMYATGVSSMGLMLASFTGPMHGINLARKSKLNFQWQPVAQGDINLRAESLRPRFYYRMDAVRSSNDTQMVWSNAIPAQYELRTSEFGIVATQKDASGNLMHLPLYVSQDGQGTTRGNYTVTVNSGAEIEEIYWSLSKEGQDGFIVYDQPLDRKPYAANQPVAIELDQVSTAGRYLLTISAELRSGLNDSVEIRFQHFP